jgi:hypothetical protein
MDEAERTIQGAGATGQLLADFRALVDATAPGGAPRHAPRPVLNWLARFIIGREGGPNRDAPLYELCHLTNAIDACGDDPDRRALFFLHGGHVQPSACAQRIDQELDSNGWRREAFSRDDDGVTIRYSDGEFAINFGRMPFLIALYEFLCGMDDYAVYGELQEIFDEMLTDPDSVTAIQEASNGIARLVRQYRRRHLRFTSQNERFELIYGFLRERAPEDRLRIDDDCVLDFWLRHSQGDDFRGYKTVFKAFANFVQALDDVARGGAAEGALSIGGNREDGEVDPGDSEHDLAAYGDWRTPFAVLDEEPAAKIKFFKKRGEREPIELLMEHGPLAVSLPLAFMRLESFGPIQAGITTDLQVKRGAASVRQRISCEDCDTYAAKRSVFEGALRHVRELQRATLHALCGQSSDPTDGNVVAFQTRQPTTLFEAALGRDNLPDIDETEEARIATDAARAFRQLTRKGFNEAALRDEDLIEGFRTGAGAILSIAARLETFLDAIARLDEVPPGLDSQHDEDRSVFSKQFAKIYGDVP